MIRSQRIRFDGRYPTSSGTGEHVPVRGYPTREGEHRNPGRPPNRFLPTLRVLLRIFDFRDAERLRPPSWRTRNPSASSSQSGEDDSSRGTRFAPHSTELSPRNRSRLGAVRRRPLVGRTTCSRSVPRNRARRCAPRRNRRRDPPTNRQKLKIRRNGNPVLSSRTSTRR